MVKKNTFSILVALLIMSLSLTGSDTFKKVSISNIPHLDKLVHLGMYFCQAQTATPHLQEI